MFIFINYISSGRWTNKYIEHVEITTYRMIQPDKDMKRHSASTLLKKAVTIVYSKQNKSVNCLLLNKCLCSVLPRRSTVSLWVTCWADITSFPYCQEIYYLLNIYKEDWRSFFFTTHRHILASSTDRSHKNNIWTCFVSFNAVFHGSIEVK